MKTVDNCIICDRCGETADGGFLVDGKTVCDNCVRDEDLLPSFRGKYEFDKWYLILAAFWFVVAVTSITQGNWILAIFDSILCLGNLILGIKEKEKYD